jgi:hypothetical protein
MADRRMGRRGQRRRRIHRRRLPSGRIDATVIAAVEAAGYVGAATEIPGDADRNHPYQLDRLEILGSDGAAAALR